VNVSLSSLGTGALLGLMFLLLLELGLMVFALVVLVRTPSERVTIGGRKWVWALIIIVINLIGPILFLFLGRKPVAAVEPKSVTPAASRATAAADTLYGAPAAPAVPPAPATPSVQPDEAEAAAATPEALAGDPEIGADGTGAGELP
jgi:hypothetical protein